MFEKDFEDMLRRYQDAIEDKKRFTALVKDLFPDQSKNVNLLLMAYNMRIATDMTTTGRINNTFAYRYVKQLMDDYGMSRINADWIVSVWCVCYGEKVLGKPCDISMQKEGDKTPAIEADTTSKTGKQYGDLFTYNKSVAGDGLTVTSFNGDKPQTIIFQNRYGNSPVVEIGDRAFFGCSSLDFIIIPDSVTFIGENAFDGTDKQFIIQCSFGSYAEEYARKNRIKYQLV